MSLNSGNKNETRKEYIKRLEDNVAILNYDIKELQDIADRYSSKYCLTRSLSDVSWHASQALETLTKKRDIIQEEVDDYAEKYKDDFLQDYREVAA